MGQLCPTLASQIAYADLHTRFDKQEDCATCALSTEHLKADPSTIRSYDGDIDHFLLLRIVTAAMLIPLQYGCDAE